MHVPASVQRYLHSIGLAPVDVPNVIATFVACKYATLASFVLVCARWRPVTTQLQKAAASTKNQERLVRLYQNSRLARRVTRRGSQFRERWEKRKHALQANAMYRRWSTWYLEKTGKLSERVAANYLWALLSRRVFLSDPKFLAVGVAEGIILCKLTVPIHVPVVFWVSAMYWKQRRAVLGLEGVPETTSPTEASVPVSAPRDEAKETRAAPKWLSLYDRYCRVSYASKNCDLTHSFRQGEE